ncbi:MAG: hypothetical protein ABW352_13975 [Polyangiales bacterium]
MRRVWALAMVVGCSGGNKEDVSELVPGDGGSDATVQDASSDAGVAPADSGTDASSDASVDSGTPLTQFTFKPSNLTLAQLPAPPGEGLRIFAPCELDTDNGNLSCSGGSGRSGDFEFATVDAEGGVRVAILRARSLTVEMAGELLARGALPLIVVTNEELNVLGRVSAASAARSAYAGGFPSPSTTGNGSGPGAGLLGTVGQFKPSGGGSYCGLGGKGALTAGLTGAQASGGPSYGNAQIVPLLGGSSGGGGASETGAGGGVVQLVSAKQITIGATGRVDAGGGGARNSASGGGSGGAVLLESPIVSLAGVLAANGGGGSAARGGSGGQDGQPSATPAAGETGTNGDDLDGAGSAGSSANGEDGRSITTNDSLGGGGGAGRIRVNTRSGSGALTGTLSPAASTSCATEGTVAAL